MDAIGGKIAIEPMTRAGQFTCDTSENIRMGYGHIKRWIEIAHANGMELRVIADFVPKVSEEVKQ